MIATLRSTLFCLLLSCMYGLQAETATDAPSTKRLVIAAHAWAPFASPESKYFGIAPRIVSQVLQAQGISVEYRFVDWQQALNGILTGQYDAALVWMAGDIKNPGFLASEPVLECRTALYFRKGAAAPASVNDLLGKRMGYNPHYIYDAESYRLLSNKQVQPIKAETDYQLFRDLLDGNSDFVLTPQLTAGDMLHNNFQAKEEDSLDYRSNFFTFPPIELVVNGKRSGSEKLVREFNANLRRLKNDGSIDRFFDDFRFSKY